MNRLQVFGIIILLVGTTILPACRHVIKEGNLINNFKFTIYVNGKHEINKYNQLIDSTRYLPLETNKNSLIGNIDKIEILEDTIILLDKVNNLLLTFDLTTGKFLNRIGEKGQCPKCFSEINDFTIDRALNLIYILDIRQRKILKYSLNGVYKGLTGMPDIFPTGFAYNRGYTVYAMPRLPFVSNGRLLNYDILVANNMKLINKYFSFNKNLYSHAFFKQPFYYYHDTLNFIRFREGQIYAITKKAVIARFNIDFGKYQLPEKFIHYGGSPQKDYAKPYSYLFAMLVENNSYVFFSFIRNTNAQFGIYSKPDSSFYILKPKEFSLSLFQPVYCYQNAFVSVINPRMFINFVKHGAKSSDSVLISLSKSIKPYDNPVLVFHYVKPSI